MDLAHVTSCCCPCSSLQLNALILFILPALVLSWVRSVCSFSREQPQVFSAGFPSTPQLDHTSPGQRACSVSPAWLIQLLRVCSRESCSCFGSCCSSHADSNADLSSPTLGFASSAALAKLTQPSVEPWSQ